jgi:hypothetical protein
MFSAVRGQIGAGEVLRLGLGFNRVQQPDAGQRFMGPCLVAFLRLKEVATGVCPASDVDRAGGIERVVAGVAVGMNEAAIAGQELLREFLLATGTQEYRDRLVRLSGHEHGRDGSCTRSHAPAGRSRRPQADGRRVTCNGHPVADDHR